MTSATPGLPPELNPRGPARAPGRPAAGRSHVRWPRLIAGVAAVAVLATSGAAWAGLNKIDNNITRIGGILTGDGSKEPPAPDEAQNILLVGSDSRDGEGNAAFQAGKGEAKVEGQRSDSMLLVHLAPGNAKATIISFPRDLYVHDPRVHRPQGQGLRVLQGADQRRLPARRPGVDHPDHRVVDRRDGRPLRPGRLRRVPAHRRLRRRRRGLPEQEDLRQVLRLQGRRRDADAERRPGAGLRAPAPRPSRRRPRPDQAPAGLPGRHPQAGPERGHPAEPGHPEQPARRRDPVGVRGRRADGLGHEGPRAQAARHRRRPGRLPHRAGRQGHQGRRPGRPAARPGAAGGHLQGPRGR